MSPIGGFRIHFVKYLATINREVGSKEKITQNNCAVLKCTYSTFLLAYRGCEAMYNVD
jgi:hypothetical protein